MATCSTTATTVKTTKIDSYLFFAVELPPRPTTPARELSTLVRADQQAAAHAGPRPLSARRHRLTRHHSPPAAQARPDADVLEKVTLIKDIAFADPIRRTSKSSTTSLSPISMPTSEFPISSACTRPGRNASPSYALSNDFYREIADWYFWAHHQVEDGTIRLPQHCDTEQEKSLFLIRLLTRVIFCWFLVEKRLIPERPLPRAPAQDALKEFNPGKDPKKPDAPRPIITPFCKTSFSARSTCRPTSAAFARRKKMASAIDKNFGITNLWRYESRFSRPCDWMTLANRVPFLNGGLFDCLDDKAGKKKDNFILDGFSDNPKLACELPNDLFFGPERTVDLSRDYGEEDKRTARSKKAKVRGLIEILSRYKFTIEENTPLEEEIALDPELLGKVFENLLASYNEDTRTTARKALGAFYTPREIVSYMVDEALKSYLGNQVPRCKGALDDLFSTKPRSATSSPTRVTH